MKNTLTLLLLLFATAGSVVAQNRVLRKSVDDSGRRLVVEIDLERDGQPVHFKGKFDVSRMDRRGKERLLNRILDSLALPRDAHRVALVDREDSEAEEASEAKEVKLEKIHEEHKAKARRVAAATSEATAPGAPTVAVGENGAFASVGGMSASSASTSDLESLVPESDPVPYSRSIDDNPAKGTLRMRYVYHQEGDERVYERTVDVRGKSQREKKHLVEETERLWKLSLTNPAL